MQLKVKQPNWRRAFWRKAGEKSLETRRRCLSAGFTLIEVVISAAIVGLVFGGVINCYIQSGIRMEWTGYSLAAQSLSAEVLEQSRSASWDPAQSIAVNQLMTMNLLSTNYNAGTQTFTGYSTSILDVPYSNTNYTLATNYVTVQMINVNGDPNVQMQFIRVDTVWPFYFRKGLQMFTNTTSTMVAPDDRQI